jgi:serine/threonine protein kinase
MEIICPKCGKIIDENAVFCGICGTNLNETVIGIDSENTSESNIKNQTPSKIDQNYISQKISVNQGVDTNNITSNNLHSSPEILVGTIVGEYRVTDFVGKGGMGWVYAGIHPIIDKKVAIKVLKSSISEDLSVVDSFINEAKAANAIGSEKIVDIFNFGQLSSGNLYFIMEFLQGENMSDFLEKEGILSYYNAHSIIPQILDALEDAHNCQIIHRDLKPENIYLSKDKKNNYNVKLLDFGIAKFKEESFSSHNTQMGVIKGTPYYMSPEQCRAQEVSAQSDIYSLGIILYQMFSGDVPFNIKSYGALIAAHLTDKPNPLNSISKELEEIIFWCLEKKIEDRPCSIHELREKLVPVLTDLAFPDIKLKKKSKTGFFLFIFLLTIFLGVTFLIFSKNRSQKEKKKIIKIPVEILHVLSVHPDVVNKEFDIGFTKWMKTKYNKNVKIKWHSKKDEMEEIRSHLVDGIKNNKNNQYDILFGGGKAIHIKLSNKNCIVYNKKNYRCSQIHKPIPSIINNIPRILNGVSIYDKNGYWYGFALSGFGIVCNLSHLKAFNLKTPQTWDDLGKPQFLNRIVSANPRFSSSTYMIFELIFQSKNWDDAWNNIIKIGANLKVPFVKGSRRVVSKVSNDKSVGCGLVIDYLFYLLKDKYENKKTKLAFILPKETAIFTPDPISILQKAPNLKLAKLFVDYVLSDGQFLMIRPLGHKQGPKEKFIPRLPVNQLLYDIEEPKHYYTNPFKHRSKFLFSSKTVSKRKKLLSILLQTAIIDNHAELNRMYKNSITNKTDITDKIIFPVKEKEFLKLLDNIDKKDKSYFKSLEHKWFKYFNELYKKLNK